MAEVPLAVKVAITPEVVLPLREAEVLRVGPDDVLIVKLPTSPPDPAELNAWKEALEYVGLSNRSVVVCGTVEFAVAPRDAAPLGDPSAPL